MGQDRTANPPGGLNMPGYGLVFLPTRFNTDRGGRDGGDDETRSREDNLETWSTDSCSFNMEGLRQFLLLDERDCEAAF